MGSMQGTQPQTPCFTIPIQGAIRKALGLPVLLLRGPRGPSESCTANPRLTPPR